MKGGENLRGILTSVRMKNPNQTIKNPSIYMYVCMYVLKT